MKYELHTLKDNIRALRIFSGANQEDAASSLNLSRSTYASYEAGLRTPDLSTLQKLSALYHVSLSELVYTPMEDLLLRQIYYKRNESALREVLPLYDALSPLEKSCIIDRIDALKREESLIIALYHRCGYELEKLSGI